MGQGDVVGLVEKAAEAVDEEKAEEMAARIAKGRFGLQDLADQLAQMRRMGGLAGILEMLPGKLKARAPAGGEDDDRQLRRQIAIVGSMTRGEKDNPKVLNASRKRRIARGSGTSVQDINRLLKMHRQMADIMKKMGRGGRGGKNLAALMGGMPSGGLPTGGMPDVSDAGIKLPSGLGLPPRNK